MDKHEWWFTEVKQVLLPIAINTIRDCNSQCLMDLMARAEEVIMPPASTAKSDKDLTQSLCL